MTAIEVPFSDLVNHPKATVEKLHASRRHKIRLHRRDGDDLVLESAEIADAEDAAMAATTRLFMSLMKNDDAAPVLLQALPEAFPWVRFLAKREVQDFLVEFIETARACVDLDNLRPLESVIYSWRSTAEINADPELRAELTRPLDGVEHGDVPSPSDS